MNEIKYNSFCVMLEVKNMRYLTHSAQETEHLAERFINDLASFLPVTSYTRPTDDRIVGLGQLPVTIFLSGELGSGKTTFVKGVAKALGIKETIKSPTFIIERVHRIKGHERFKHLVHIDAYRLENGEELKHLGWEEIARDPENLILIEWPEKVAEVLPKNYTLLKFRVIKEDKREINLSVSSKCQNPNAPWASPTGFSQIDVKVRGKVKSI